MAERKGSRDLLASVDDCAVVVDDHTGKVKAQFVGFGATDDANAHLRHCQHARVKVDHLSSASVISGEEARKVMRKGRV